MTMCHKHNFLFFFSIRDDSTVQSYVDCEWLRTDILKKDSFDTPEDSDLIIGYLFLVRKKHSFLIIQLLVFLLFFNSVHKN